MKRKTAIVLIFSVMLFITACSDTNRSEPKKSSTDFFAMDTYMNIIAYGENAKQAILQAQKQIKHLDSLWSVTDENSEIFAVNHNNGKATAVSEETSELLTFSLKMAERTKGALDPTIYPILNAWGFTTEKYRIPSQNEIKSLLKRVGYDKVKLTDNSIQLDSGIMLDFGAVGKGYASDISAEILKKSGITSALLDLGGNIKTISSKPNGSEWRLGVRNPKGKGNIGVLSVSDLAVVTSGNYERYFTGKDGKTYGHIIDPATGQPVENGLLSVTIIAKDGKLCDALSTSLFVMGLDKAIEHWRKYKDFDMILITDDEKIYLTNGIKDKFSVNKNNNMKVNVINLNKN